MKIFKSKKKQVYLSVNNTRNAPLSGLKNKALKLSLEDIPSRSEVRSILPKYCFKPNTIKSLRYLAQTVLIQIFVVWIGLNIPLEKEYLPIWIIYACFSGTTAMGLWVLAHECGHGAFSNNRNLQSITGYILHSLLLVPYFSWQRSHAVHHAYTNHITSGETHVPLVIEGDGVNEIPGGENDLASSIFLGKTLYGLSQLIIHLIFGWPAYLLFGKTGGPKYGVTNHFWPIAPFSKKLWPSNWAKKVWLSDWGILIVIAGLIFWSSKTGLSSVLAIYLAPLLVVNIWLVVYTWLHHSDSDVPHLSGSEFSYMRGAFLSIDRPYGKILDFLHHRIGSTHVIHHIEPTVPHYYAKDATKAIKEKFPNVYLYNPTPIHRSLWHIATNCIAVKKEMNGEKYIWQQY